jgi:hexosaminidase
MARLFIVVACWWIVSYHTAYGRQVSPEIIPIPSGYSLMEGTFAWDGLVVLEKGDFPNQASFLQSELLRMTGISLSEGRVTGKRISLQQVPGLGTGYRLKIGESAILLSATQEKGAFYAVVSLLQLIRASIPGTEGTLQLPNWHITDRPVYEWRGLMLDESRYFFGMEKVKQLLDYMAYYKLNTFHWHLTDAPGWRIDIQAYPRLALVGGIGNHSDPNAPARYYRQEEIREIVRYAAERMIEVIPEIDMPGHATAANRAYPEFSGGGSDRYPDFTFHPAREGTYAYLSRILKEVDMLFPGNKIHLGGDEVSFGNQMWPEDPQVQQLMQKEGLTGLKGVEDYFFKRMADTLFRWNNQVLAWDEMAEAGLPRDQTIIFWWRHDKKEQLFAALNGGYATVLCPRIPFYFDFVQEASHRYGRKWAGAFAPLQAVYDFSAENLGLDATQQKKVLGIQANLWTETVDREQRLDFLLFPRIAALSESAWSAPDTRNFDDFMRRLPLHLKQYQDNKLYFYHPGMPDRHPEPVYQP